jgi:uncharacterized protein (TIGR02270 family)
MSREILADGIGVLWRSREVAVLAPNVRLASLIGLDERIDAYVEALEVHFRSDANCLYERMVAGEPELAFGAYTVALHENVGVFVRLMLGTPDASPLPPTSPRDAGSTATQVKSRILAALAWSDRTPARAAIESLLPSPDPTARAIAIAAVGARRSNVPDDLLATFAADLEPLPRARAFRTAGQLGRLALMPQLLAARADPDPECRFWAAWSAARLGATEPFGVLAEIARGTGPRADAALEMLLRRVPVEQGNAWLSAYARNLPDRRRSLVRATGILGDPLYIPWLLACMEEADISRVAGEAVAMITGLDIAYLDMDRDPPEGFETGPNDDPADENVALDEDEWLPWPDPRKIGAWWGRNARRFPAGTAFFLGEPKQSANWLGALSDAFQRQRLAAAMELAIRQPGQPMFEARARGRLQRQQLAQAMGKVSSAGSSAPS